MTIPDAAPGTYYVHVQRNKNHGGYSLTYNFTANSYDNDVADNDEAGKGTEIAIGQTVQGHIGYKDASDYRDDNDWYKFEVTQDGQVDLVFNCDQTYELALNYVDICWKSSDNYYYVRQGTGWYPDASGTVTIPDAAPGIYYVHVQRNKNHGGYTLTYNFTANSYGNDVADNDEAGQGTEIAIGQTVQGHIGYIDGSDYRDDNDWYTIQVPQDGQVDLVFNCDQTYELALNYVDICYKSSDGYYYVRQGTGWYPAASDTVTIVDAGVGTYYVHIQRNSRHGGYSLTYNFTANSYGNDTEPNDEREQAKQTLGADELLYAHLGYTDASNSRDDNDWFLLNTQKLAAMLTLNVVCDPTSTLKLNYVDIVRRKGDAQSVAVSSGWYPTSPITLNLTEVDETAEYYVHVQRNSGNGGYTLSYDAPERLEISGVHATPTGSWSIVTLGGTVVASGTEGTPSPRLTPGVYVIRQGGQSRKVIVK